MSFNRFAEAVSIHVSRAWFFALALVAVIAWLPTLWLAEPGISDLIVDAITNPISLLLLVLLHNGAFRAERASDARSDHLAEAIADVMQQLARQEPDHERRSYLEHRAARLLRVSEEQHAFQVGDRDEPDDEEEGDDERDEGENETRAPGNGPTDRTG